MGNIIFTSLLLIKKNSQRGQGRVGKKEHSTQAKWSSLKKRKQYVTLSNLVSGFKAGLSHSGSVFTKVPPSLHLI